MLGIHVVYNDNHIAWSLLDGLVYQFRFLCVKIFLCILKSLSNNSKWKMVRNLEYATKRLYMKPEMRL